MATVSVCAVTFRAISARRDDASARAYCTVGFATAHAVRQVTATLVAGAAVRPSTIRSGTGPSGRGSSSPANPAAPRSAASKPVVTAMRADAAWKTARHVTAEPEARLEFGRPFADERSVDRSSGLGALTSPCRGSHTTSHRGHGLPPALRCSARRDRRRRRDPAVGRCRT